MRRALVRSGGSIPIVAELAARGIRRSSRGFALADDDIHAPNESFRLASLELGERAARELLRALAALPRGVTARAARAARLSAGIAALAAALWALAGRGLVNYDTLYSLVWGRELVQGRTARLRRRRSPRRRTRSRRSPASSLVAAQPRSDAGVHGEAAQTRRSCSRSSPSALLGWVVFALGSAWFGPAAGVLAAAIVLTRRPVLDFGARAYVDIPYLALVLGALLVETRRPRAGAPVLALLARRRPDPAGGVAVLAPPTSRAWCGAASATRGAWRALARSPRPRPLLWALSDLVVTGDPLHSLTGTRDNAETLGRVTGLDDVPADRAAAARRDPARAGAVRRRGRRLVLSWLAAARPGAARRVAAGVLALAAFCVLAAAGPADPRALPAAARGDRRDLLRRRRLRLAGAPARATRGAGRGPGSAWSTLVLLLAFVPAPGRPHRATCATRSRVQDDDPGRPARARARPPGAIRAGCAPVGVPNHRPVPLLALWLDVPPGGGRRACRAARSRAARTSRPATRAGRARLHPRPARPATSDPAPPPGFTLVAGNALVARLQALRAGVRIRAAAESESGPCTLRRSGLAGAGAGARLRLGDSRYARR